MSKLLKIEMMKLKTSLAFKITIIVCAAMCLMNVAVYAFIANLDKIIDVSADESLESMQNIFGGMIDGRSLFNMAVSNPSDYMMMAVIVICIMVCGDFSARTLQAQIIAGFSRTKIFLSRLVSSLFILFVFFVIYVGLLTFGTGIFCGYGPEGLTGASLLTMLKQFTMSYVMSGSILTMYLLIVFCAKSIGPSIGICLPLMLIGTGIISAIGSINDTAYEIYLLTPFGQQSLVTAELDFLEYFKYFAVAIVFAAIMIFIAAKSFKKAEMK